MGTVNLNIRNICDIMLNFCPKICTVLKNMLIYPIFKLNYIYILAIIKTTPLHSAIPE